jgi:Flp pilus assembly protein CpaB
MRRGRILIFLVLIVVIGLALLYFAFTQFGGLTGVVPPTQAALTEVYFAAQNIPQGTEITQEMLGTFSIPPENVAEVMFTVGEEGALMSNCSLHWIGSGHPSSMVGKDQ